jgi:uncharacterized protein GlcG (DUF336 family)
MKNSIRFPVLLLALASFCFALPASADEAHPPLIQVKTLTLESALIIAQAAVKQSHANGATNVGVCVVDYAGRVLVLLRDDNATEHTVLGSERKAWTAANYKDSTRNLLARIKKADGDDDQLVYNEKSLFLWGGVPIKDGNDMVGAIGICGNPSGYQDDAVAAAASTTLANLLKASKP